MEEAWLPAACGFGFGAVLGLVTPESELGALLVLACAVHFVWVAPRPW